MIALALLCTVNVAAAHPLRFGVMTVRPEGSELEVRLRFSGAEGADRTAEPVLPPDCRAALVDRAEFAFGQERTWRVRCDGPLRFAGVSGIGEDGGIESEVWLEVEGHGRWLLDASAPVIELDGARESERSVFERFTALGLEHILGGLDHLLFLFALVLLVRDRWPLVKSVTGFTLGHSVTLGLATLGAVSLPAPPVEAAIAASIVVLAAELLRDGGAMRKHPALVSTAFGLVHGLGFAGALRDAGVPERELPWALVAFNAGVELGQLVCVIAMLLVIALARRIELPRAAALAPYAIGTVAAVWCAARVAAFWQS
jgi:hydrogenase/urease accessory protein HupE